MITILKQLAQFADHELYKLSEAIDLELQRREELTIEVPESAKRRAVERGQSYRRRLGAQAPRVRVVGIGRWKGPRRAA
jgi:hypothetical protein